MDFSHAQPDHTLATRYRLYYHKPLKVVLILSTNPLSHPECKVTCKVRSLPAYMEGWEFTCVYGSHFEIL